MSAESHDRFVRAVADISGTLTDSQREALFGVVLAAVQAVRTRDERGAAETLPPPATIPEARAALARGELPLRVTFDGVRDELTVCEEDDRAVVVEGARGTAVTLVDLEAVK